METTIIKTKKKVTKRYFETLYKETFMEIAYSTTNNYLGTSLMDKDGIYGSLLTDVEYYESREEVNIHLKNEIKTIVSYLV